MHSIEILCVEYTRGSEQNLWEHLTYFYENVYYSCSYVLILCRSSRYVHKFSVETVQWYPYDTGMFVSSSFDKTVKVWDTEMLKVMHVLYKPNKVYSNYMWYTLSYYEVHLYY